MDLLDLYNAYTASRKGKRRSADAVQFELHQFANLQKLLDDINQERIPADTYTFIHHRQKSREVWACLMELKILQTMLDQKLRPAVEAELTPHTFNNRKGMGTHAAINNVIEDIAKASEGYTRDCWIIKLDLKGYFPNINQDLAWANTRRLIEQNFEGEERDMLLHIAEHINYLNPQFNTARRSPIEEWNDEIQPYKSLFTKPFGTGAAIGFLYWQVMSNLHLNEVDKWIIKNITPHYTRFVDDMVLVTTNKALTLAQLPRLRTRLKLMGVEMHPRKFYCQHYTKGVEFLGYHIKPHAIHLNRKIVKRAFRVKPRGRERYLCQMNSYLGMLKVSTDRHLVDELLASVRHKGIEADYTRKVARRKVHPKSDKMRKNHTT